MTPLLPFVELEFVHAIGPGAGRYVVAVDGEEGEAGTQDVLQIKIVDGTTTTKGLRRRTRDESAAAVPTDVPVLRVMWIGAGQPAATQGEASGRLERLRRQEDEREELVEAILGVLNTAIRAHRAAARDPYVAEVTRADPRAVRFGFGEARPLTQGQWTEAFLAPAPRPPSLDRAVKLGPSETVALALRGTLDLLESEELVLRASLDLDQERWRAAGAQLVAAVDLLRAEFTAARQNGVAVLVQDDDLARRGERVRSLSQLARGDELDEIGQAELRSHADALGDALEGWRVPG